jgi:GNAT superfamily N-acetyltransferase
MAIKRKKVESLVSSAGLSRRGGLSVRAKLSIRFGTARDMPLILKMIRGLAEYEHLAHEVKATAAHLRRDGSGRHPYFRTLVCSRSRKIVGFALYFYTYSTFAGRPSLYIEDLFVLPGERDKGAGKMLLRDLARIALRAGCGRMEWVVLRENDPAIRFYKRIGAKLHEEWIVTRLSGDHLRNLAEAQSGKLF